MSKLSPQVARDEWVHQEPYEVGRYRRGEISANEQHLRGWSLDNQLAYQAGRRARMRSQGRRIVIALVSVALVLLYLGRGLIGA